jgi:hypothetical protein
MFLPLKFYTLLNWIELPDSIAVFVCPFLMVVMNLVLFKRIIDG